MENFFNQLSQYADVSDYVRYKRKVPSCWFLCILGFCIVLWGTYAVKIQALTGLTFGSIFVNGFIVIAIPMLLACVLTVIVTRYLDLRSFAKAVKKQIFQELITDNLGSNEDITYALKLANNSPELPESIAFKDAAAKFKENLKKFYEKHHSLANDLIREIEEDPCAQLVITLWPSRGNKKFIELISVRTAGAMLEYQAVLEAAEVLILTHADTLRKAPPQGANKVEV